MRLAGWAALWLLLAAPQGASAQEANTVGAGPGASEPNPPASPTPLLAKDEKQRSPARIFAEYGEGIGVESLDGKFAISLKARAQLRTTVTVPDEDPEGTTADFQVRRLRLSLDGHAFDKVLSFKIQLAFAPLDQDPVAPFPIRDAYLTFEPHRDFALRAGQMKVPFGRQRVVSSGSLQMVDRSTITGELNMDRDVGIQAFSEDFLGLDGALGYHLGVFGGDGRNRVSASYGLLYTARLELRPLLTGPVDLGEPDLKRTRKPLMELGLSGAFNHDSDRQRSTIGSVFETGAWADYLHVGFDGALKYRGLSVTSEFFYRDALTLTNELVEGDETLTDVARTGFGGFAQAGYLFDEHAEVALRYGTLHPLHGGDGGVKREQELGGAFSYYFKGHALKLQTDYFYLFEELGEGKHQVRFQVQVAP